MTRSGDPTGLMMALCIVALALGATLLVVSTHLASPPPPEMKQQRGTTATSEDAALPGSPALAPSPEATWPYPGVYPYTPTPDPLPAERLDPTRAQVYVVQSGDTLSSIAYAFGCTVEDIATANSVVSDSIWPGQLLTIPVGATDFGPALKLIPDSEAVYSPAHVPFDLGQFVAGQHGYLARYTEEVEGRLRTGGEIVGLVAQRYSVGPRVLLALLEWQAGWVTDDQPPAETLYYPMGNTEQGREGLFEQLSWAAAELNSGYYGWKYRNWTTIRLSDGERIGIASGLNAGSVAVQNYLGRVASGDQWWGAVGPGGFAATYDRLFGNPFAYTVDPLLPAGLAQPELRFPWEGDQMWYLTSGPHGGWGRGSGWAALDFVPPGQWGCQPAPLWVTAAAPGLVVRSDNGEVVVDLDGDGHEQTGWVLTYLHIHQEGRVEAGTWLAQGQRIGHPSCDGGYADATHLHLARRYNGEWIPAGSGPVPLVISGWTAHEAVWEYDGTLTQGNLVRQACQCTNDEVNGLVSDNSSGD